MRLQKRPWGFTFSLRYIERNLRDFLAIRGKFNFVSNISVKGVLREREESPFSL